MSCRPSCIRGTHGRTKKGKSAKGGSRRTKANGRSKKRGGEVEVQVIDDSEAHTGIDLEAESAVAMDTSGDVEVDEIVEGMENLSAKIVPSNLSFGRSARRGMQRGNHHHRR